MCSGLFVLFPWLCSIVVWLFDGVLKLTVFAWLPSLLGREFMFILLERFKSQGVLEVIGVRRRLSQKCQELSHFGEPPLIEKPVSGKVPCGQIVRGANIKNSVMLIE